VLRPSILPDHGDDRDIDLREDVSRHADDRGDTEKKYEASQHVKSMWQPQRKANYAHNASSPRDHIRSLRRPIAITTLQPVLEFKSPVICARFVKCEIDLIEIPGGVRHRAFVTPCGFLLIRPPRRRLQSRCDHRAGQCAHAENDQDGRFIEPCASLHSLILGASWKTFARCSWPHRMPHRIRRELMNVGLDNFPASALEP
jgi:hypothetical protein